MSSTSVGSPTVPLSPFTARLALLRPFHAPTHAATPPSNLHRRMAARRGARRTDSAPDRPSARRGQPVRPCPAVRRPSSASSRDCLYTANNARSTAGLTSAGLDGRTWRCAVLTEKAAATVAIVMSRHRTVIVACSTSELVIERRARRRFD